MIAIGLTFLTGRYHATPWGRHVNEGVPEWPPSPWRLLRGLIAAWKKTQPEMPADLVGRLLSKLTHTPDFHLPSAAAAMTRHYMPDNRGNTSMVFDTFAACDKTDAVYAVWNDAVLDSEECEALKKLLAGLTYLGRAESWCEAYLSDSPSPINCRPISEDGELEAETEPVRVLTPNFEPDPENLLTNLLLDTDEIRKKRRRLDPPGAQWTYYARPQTALTSGIVESAEQEISERSSSSDLPGEPIVNNSNRIVLIRFAIHANPLPLLKDAVQIGEQVRRACMSRYGKRNDNKNSPILSGRSVNQLLKGHRHTFYLPQDEDLDGRLDHVTLFAYGGFETAVLDSVASIRYVTRSEGLEPLHLLLLGLLDYSGFQSQTSPLKQAKTWRSITPFVLGRHPKVNRKGRPKVRPDGRQIDGPEDQVRQEWEIRREIDPTLPDIVKIEADPQCSLNGRTMRWLEFRRWRDRGGSPASARGYGFKVHFAQPVAGPIVLGYGCHFGLGQFRPAEE